MPPATQMADDLAELEDLTFEELLSPASAEDTDAQAIYCVCCCTSCGC
jgi:hypothetical protein